MSNAELKQQIEAAKIALVHSAEASTPTDMPPASDRVTQISSINNDHAQAHSDRPENMAHVSAGSNTTLSSQEAGFPEMVQQSDFEKLETRLQGLEDQIRNQQRDLHTLLQKLREITAKSQAAAKPKKSKGAKKWLVGGVLCALGLCGVFYGLGIETISATFYRLTGLAVALIDVLASKI